MSTLLNNTPSVPHVEPLAPDPSASLMVAWRIGGQPALVVGGGPVAAQRARVLRMAGAAVRVVAPEINAELAARLGRGEIEVERRAWRPDDLDGVAVVMVATDDPALSVQVALACRARRIPVNTADVPEWCDFYLPALHLDGPVQIAVSTGGEGPVLAARLRDLVARALPSGVSDAVRRFGAIRRAIRQADPDASSGPLRMRFLKDLGATWALPALAAADPAEIVQAYLGGAAPTAPVTTAPEVKPVVTRVAATSTTPPIRLVGAGPGDPDLLTVGALRALQEADLVLCDRLVPEPIRALVPGTLIVARKAAGEADESQADLDRAAIDAARAGQRVVRLKIGDPGIFGRLGEELATYAQAGLTAEVLPGVSSALAAPALAGVPLTLRGVADRVVLLTGHGAGDGRLEVLRWQAGTTTVVLMAAHRLDALAASLRDGGYPDDLPALIVQHASLPGERRAFATLRTLADVARAEGIGAPAIVVFGEVVRAVRRDAVAA